MPGIITTNNRAVKRVISQFILLYIQCTDLFAVKIDTRNTCNQGIQMDGQDWTPVIISKKSYASALRSATIALPAVKYSNQAHHLAKVEAAEAPVKMKTLSAESRQKIVAYRTLKQITQKQLDQACAFPANTMRELESGRMTPSSGQLNTLNRFVGGGINLV
jgi:DNA-binding transcriptional regulator YiaG